MIAEDFQKFVLTELSRGGMRFQRVIIGNSTCLRPVKLSAPTAKFSCKIWAIKSAQRRN